MSVLFFFLVLLLLLEQTEETEPDQSHLDLSSFTHCDLSFLSLLPFFPSMSLPTSLFLFDPSFYVLTSLSLATFPFIYSLFLFSHSSSASTFPLHLSPMSLLLCLFFLSSIFHSPHLASPCSSISFSPAFSFFGLTMWLTMVAALLVWLLLFDSGAT